MVFLDYPDGMLTSIPEQVLAAGACSSSGSLHCKQRQASWPPLELVPHSSSSSGPCASAQHSPPACGTARCTQDVREAYAAEVRRFQPDAVLAFFREPDWSARPKLVASASLTVWLCQLLHPSPACGPPPHAPTCDVPPTRRLAGYTSSAAG